MPATRSTLGLHCGGFKSNALSPAVNGLLSARGNIGKGANSASLNLVFAGASSLDSRLTFSRTTNATYFNFAGLLTLASAGTPRLDYNPATLAAQGLLIEEQRVNLLTYSSDFDNAGWTKTNATVSANDIASPDGANNADFYDDGTTTSPHYLAQAPSITVSTTYTASVFAKKNNLNFISVGITDVAIGDRFAVASFNINTGAVSASLASGAGYVVASTSISSVGNGWYRCVIVATVGSTATAPRFVIASGTDGTVPAAGGGFQTYTGANNKTYLYGAQLEAGAFATSYAPSVNTFTSRSTTGTFFDSAGVLQSAAINVARNTYNPANLAAQPYLLLEEARTNFFTNASGASGGSIGTGTVLGPDNVLCRTFIPTAGVQSFPSVSGPNQTFSAGLGATVDWALSGWLAEGPAGTPTLEPRLIFNVSVNGTTSFIYAELQINTSTWTVRSKTLGAGLSEISAPSITLFKTGLYRVTWVVRYTQDATARNSISAAIQARNTAGSGNYTADGVSGVQYALVQAETGSFVTSTIPTTTTALTRAADLSSSAQATRAADVASVNTLSPWYNASESTLYTEYSSPVPTTVSASAVVAGYDDGTASNRFSNFYTSLAPNSLAANQTTAGVPNYTISAASGVTLSNVQKQATRLQAGSYASSANGAAAVTDTFASAPPTVTTLRFGLRPSGTQANMWLRRVTVYPRGLSNAELQSLTT